MAAVKGGVEAGDLRRRREGLHRRFDPGAVVRLVQRGERNEPPEFRQRRGVDQHRLDEVRPAVHHAMADRRNRTMVALRAQPAENGAHRRLMIDAAVRWFEDELGLFARGRLDGALRRRADSLDLPRRELIQCAAIDVRESGESQ